MRAILAFILVFSSLSGFGSTFEWKNFSFGASSFTPSDWKSSAFLDGSWSPQIDLGSVAVRLGLGASALKDSADKRFLTSYYQAAIMLPVISLLSVEGSFGYRTFHRDEMGTHPEWGGGFLMRPGEAIDRIYICMSRYLIPDNTTSIFRVGISISF
jgi:hypothetical protein